MTEIQRCALMGDKEAQDKCTEMRILLPCPKCHKPVRIESMDRELDSFSVTFKCTTSGLSYKATQEMAWNDKNSVPLSPNPFCQWNSRPSPVFGKCKECAYFKSWGECNESGTSTTGEDFCSKFTPREETI